MTLLDDQSILRRMSNPAIKTPPVVRRRGRPPKSENGYSETREALLQAGVEVLTEKGFSASSIEEILTKVGVPKGSFYHFFASKETFGAALIARYDAYFSQKLDRFLLDEGMAPLHRLRAFINNAKSGMKRFDYHRGCLVGNLGQEMAHLPDTLRLQVRAVFENWEGRVALCLEAAKHQGEIGQDADCKRLAAYFWIAWEGAVLRAKLDGAPKALDIFEEFFFAGLLA